MHRCTLAFVLGAMIATLAAPLGRAQSDDLLSGWQFAPGDAGEGLTVDAARMPPATTPVVLPHRVNEPNRSLWYSRSVLVPPGTALLVDADDGAQVFADGVRLAQHRRWFFVPDSAVAARHIIVRVLNNAMSGGLRSIRPVPAADVRRDALEVRPLPAGFAPVETAAFRERMPSGDSPCRFTAWADSQGGWETFAKLVALMALRRPHFSVGVGDLVNDGSDVHAWRSFVDRLAPLASHTPLVPVAGNHDYDGHYNDLRARHYLDLFRPDGTSWFSWSCGVVRLVAIDVNREFPIGVSPSSEQYRWLMNEIRSREWSQAGWRVLLVHQPPWSRSWAGYDGDAAVRNIVSSLAPRGLDLVISGHSHAYERLVRTVGTRPVNVLISGGGGGGLEAPLAQPSVDSTIVLRHHFVDIHATSAAMTFDAIDTEGRSLDRWRLAR